MELPTYTNIWKIEKRLYKLYDFRLPMPLPVGQVTAFLAIAVPYAIVLAMAGAPVSHTWLWVYVLPPGALAWVITRPVLEGKRLPELILSQLRYLSEPQTWCRMAPLAERDEISVVARVWRWTAATSVSQVSAAEVSPGALAAEASSEVLAAEVSPGVLAAEAAPEVSADAQSMLVASAGTGQDSGSAELQDSSVEPHALAAEVGTVQSAGAGMAGAGTAESVTAASVAAAVAPGRPAPWPAPDMASPASIFRPASGAATTAGSRPAAASSGPTAASAGPTPAGSGVVGPNASAAAADTGGQTVPDGHIGGWLRARGRAAGRGPVVTVKGDLPRLAERALHGSPGGRGGRPVALPDRHRSGKPDRVQRDRARARLPIPGPARIVVLGCTGGAGQTLTALLTGTLLASLRGEPVAVLDLSPGPGSLYDQARAMPRMLAGLRSTDRPRAGDGGRSTAAGSRPSGAAPPPRSARERGLQVVTADDPAQDAASLIDAVVARYPLTIADPSGRNVAPALQAADQLMLVAPASQDAAGALAMMLEWLEVNGHDRLARAAVTVLTGFSASTMQYVDKAAAVASGRCRAIVRVPWDEQLAALARPPAAGREPKHQSLSATAIQAYTALAGVLVSALTESLPARSPQ